MTTITTPPARMLTSAQAAAVYLAMQALNSVNGDLREIVLPDNERGYATIQVEDAHIRVLRWTRTKGSEEELYSSQIEFVAAYGLAASVAFLEPEPSSEPMPGTKQGHCSPCAYGPRTDGGAVGVECTKCGFVIPF